MDIEAKLEGVDQRERQFKAEILQLQDKVSGKDIAIK